MKKIFLMASAAALFFSSCGDLDINESPNNPSGGNVTANLIMPSVENCVATITGDGLYNITGFLAQYFEQAPVGNQYNDITWYNIQPSSQLVDRSYAMAYANALQDIEEIKGKTTNTADLFAATVLRAYTLQMLVDATGETPYSEALKGSEISKPHYDNGEDVYAGVLQEMDDAEAALNPEDLMETNDLLLNKDLDQWKGFANALRLRMYLRMISGNIDAANYTAKLKTLVSEGNFFTGDIAFDAYSDEANKRNPWYSANYINLAQNHVASLPIVSYMTLTNDPRIAYTFVTATVGDNAGQYAGRVPGSHQQAAVGTFNDIGYFSALNYYATKPVMFFTQAELQFLLAECYIKYFSDLSSAQSAYEAGVRADFDARSISGADQFLAGSRTSWASAASNDDKLKLIYMQKWVALLYMDHMEAWSEMRRTGTPAFGLTAQEYVADPTQYTAGDLIYPYRDMLGTKKAPLRLPYCFSSTNINENAPKQPDITTTPVFWDK